MSIQWTRARAVGVALGGVAGATLRWAVVTVIEPGRFPWSVLAINLAGSLLLGVLLAEEWDHPQLHLLLRDAGAIGFCGGLTTFSTFAVEVATLLRDGEASLAVVYAVASVAGALLAVLTGAAALRRLKAVLLPVEDA